MLLTIDVGNSNTVFVIYDGDTIVSEKRLITLKKDFSDYYTSNLRDLDYTFDGVIVSCVVPVVLEAIVAACESSLGIIPSVVSASNMKNFEILLENPEEIGADFIATSIGALAKYNAPVIVADIGSATKLTLTDVDHRFAGGVILPGLGTSVKGLTEFIPHLPEVGLVVPEHVVGTSTISAIQSGIMYGLIAQIEGIANRMEKEKGISCVKVLTGGYARLIKAYLPEFIYDDTLLNDGLQTMYKERLLKK